MGGRVSYESGSSLGIDPATIPHLPDPTVTTISVQVRRLDTILAQHAPDIGEIDVLAVDVESWELTVMRGIDLAKYRPKVVILENFRDDAGYLSFMRDAGYIYWKHIMLNDVYVRADMKPFIPPRPMREVARERLIRAGLLEVARRVKKATNAAKDGIAVARWQG